MSAKTKPHTRHVIKQHHKERLERYVKYPTNCGYWAQQTGTMHTWQRLYTAAILQNFKSTVIGHFRFQCQSPHGKIIPIKNHSASLLADRSSYYLLGLRPCVIYVIPRGISSDQWVVISAMKFAVLTLFRLYPGENSWSIMITNIWLRSGLNLHTWKKCLRNKQELRTSFNDHVYFSPLKPTVGQQLAKR